MAIEPGRGRGDRFRRRYPPLVVMFATIMVLVLMMPSALRVPQQDPTPVLEYAPVPPEDDQPPNPQGNLNTLSLGNSNTLEEGIDTAPPPAPPGSGDRPIAKRCVGNPPRQTEDPMAPPCVPYFDGDNGGATWQGVSKDEITVLIYFDRGCPNHECAPQNRYYMDLDKPAQPPCPKTWPADNGDANKCDFIFVRVTRAFSAFFNERFQTYGRRVHYWAYVSSGGSVVNRRADAADNWQKLRPFAVIDYATYFGNNDAYGKAMAARGVLVFTSRTLMPNSYYNIHPRFSWGFWPDIEHWSDLYATYVCTKVAPYPVRRMGSPPGAHPSVGSERKFGLWYTRDTDEAALRLFADLVKKKLTKCGVSWEAEATFRHSGFAVDNSDHGTDAAEAVSRFRGAGVTTVLYLGGMEGKFSQVADSQSYYPEIVVAGDLENDNNNAGRAQNQKVWANAWGTQLQLRIGKPSESPGAQAYRAGSPHGPEEDLRFANEAYRDHFMLFQAIQVAGPRLTPESVDRGFHAIPPKASTNPYIASCFFDPGDYTCVKDASEMWWDPAAQSPSDGQPGCYRLVREGRRFLAGTWEGGDDAFRDNRDPCTGFDSRFQINP